ncbi:MarR family winged helix-turn-helix transcriptional regulator [Priestia taiwanensis]|uniref:MarR family transcriptional regulator n=1 Tax=Priestia taiwanensis TaxID=1347902 RepID=A0A917EPZ6_9BACI|nr:MarR family transcriptional regulator [Priestia taiwanensis]MBM7364007.1 MarR family 2-MHQ and catechol resistance regulon transcriptional repressor [Priestia taiwanensis]GGE70901.1 MarR family transcriptional regulator [Priestia taiwanensis]
MNEREDIQQSLKLFVVLSRAYRSIQDISAKSIKSFGLNPTEFAVLELLFHRGPQPLQQIGDRILIASGSITYVVDKLVDKELVIRKPCEKDRRISYAKLTDKGNVFMEDIFPQHEEVLHEALQTLTAEEKDDVIGLLKKLKK